MLQFQVLLYTAGGEHLQTFRPYENALGVKTVAWHPNGHLLALGSYDQRARLLNSLTWQRVAECVPQRAIAARLDKPIPAEACLAVNLTSCVCVSP